jgi:hypothetical protein
MLTGLGNRRRSNSGRSRSSATYDPLRSNSPATVRSNRSGRS